MFKVPENHRIKVGVYASDEKEGNNGIFIVPLNHGTIKAMCIVSDGMDWEHVSVSLWAKKGNSTYPIPRCPTWEEMCQIKEMFWDEDDCVMQLHPPKQDYISNHEYCLHLWRPICKEIPKPDKLMVGL